MNIPKMISNGLQALESKEAREGNEEPFLNLLTMLVNDVNFALCLVRHNHGQFVQKLMDIRKMYSKHQRCTDITAEYRVFQCFQSVASIECTRNELLKNDEVLQSLVSFVTTDISTPKMMNEGLKELILKRYGDFRQLFWAIAWKKFTVSMAINCLLLMAGMKWSVVLKLLRRFKGERFSIESFISNSFLPTIETKFSTQHGAFNMEKILDIWEQYLHFAQVYLRMRKKSHKKAVANQKTFTVVQLFIEENKFNQNIENKVLDRVLEMVSDMVSLFGREVSKFNGFQRLVDLVMQYFERGFLLRESTLFLIALVQLNSDDVTTDIFRLLRRILMPNRIQSGKGEGQLSKKTPYDELSFKGKSSYLSVFTQCLQSEKFRSMYVGDEPFEIGMIVATTTEFVHGHYSDSIIKSTTSWFSSASPPWDTGMKQKMFVHIANIWASWMDLLAGEPKSCTIPHLFSFLFNEELKVNVILEFHDGLLSENMDVFLACSRVVPQLCNRFKREMHSYYEDLGFERLQERYQLPMKNIGNTSTNSVVVARALKVSSAILKVCQLSSAGYRAMKEPDEDEEGGVPITKKSGFTQSKRKKDAKFISKGKMCDRCHINSGVKVCSRCKKRRYCGRSCQTKDWKNHKRVCKPYQLDDNTTRIIRKND